MKMVSQNETAEHNAPLVLSKEHFEKQVDDCINNKLNRFDDIAVCNTPEILLMLGYKQLPMFYTKNHLRNAIKAKSPKNQHWHGLSVKQIKQLPDLIKEPAMIYNSLTSPDSLILVTNELDKDNMPLIVAIKPHGTAKLNNSEVEANFITSVYGRNNFLSHIKEVISLNKMIYLDVKKSHQLLSVLRLQLSQGFSNDDFNNIIAYLNSFVNPINKNNFPEEKRTMTNEELLQQLSAQLGANNQLVSQLIDKINGLEQKVNETTEQLQTVTQKQEMFTSHFNQIYNAKSMEETLGIMSDLGKSDMEVESCDVYSYDALEDKLFTVDEDSKRVFTDISEDTPISAALLKNEIFIDNNYTGGDVGDYRDNTKVQNIAVIPIEAKSGEVIGVVVAKNKPTEFTKEDVDKFNLTNGKIGSAFRMGLENKALKQAAITDKLTHLHNRQGAQEYLKNTVLPNIQEGNNISTIMIDIDKFKSFNDTYGHDIGDKVLKQVAGILKDNIRSSDGVFRWGGEEMVVIANMDALEAYALADRLRQTIQDTPLDIGNGKSVQITASMGVAQLMTDTPQRLNADNIMDYFENKPLKRADERLYEAKENGRNQVVASQAVMRSVQQDRRKPSVIGAIKTVKEETQNRPQPPKEQAKDTHKKHSHDLS